MYPRYHVVYIQLLAGLLLMLFHGFNPRGSVAKCPPIIQLILWPPSVPLGVLCQLLQALQRNKELI